GVWAGPVDGGVCVPARGGPARRALVRCVGGSAGGIRAGGAGASTGAGALMRPAKQRIGTRKAERALRALLVSGRRLIEREDGWVVVPGDRRCRPIVEISDAEAQDIIANGSVQPAKGGGYVLSGEREEERPWTEVAAVIAMAKQGRVRKVRGFAELA